METQLYVCVQPVCWYVIGTDTAHVLVCDMYGYSLCAVDDEYMYNLSAGKWYSWPSPTAGLNNIGQSKCRQILSICTDHIGMCA